MPMTGVRACRRRVNRDGGQIVVTFALALTLFLVGLIGLVADLSTMFGASANVSQAAQAGAFAGAADVDYANFRQTGVVRLSATAGQTCERAIQVAYPGATGTCTVDPAVPYQIKVVSAKSVLLPVGMGLTAPTVGATFSAFAQSGTAVPGAN
jgi:Flp pilus assembly protein TadG